MRRAVLLAGLVAMACGTVGAAEAPPRAGGDFTVAEAGPTAFSTMAPALADQWRDDFARGRTIIGRPWVTSPAEDTDFDGLGPLFNRLSCAACHPRNGGGYAPASASEPMRTMLVRLSVPGQDAHGGPKPHPAYGDQLNDNAVPGIAPEGQAVVHWQERTETLPGGEKVSLRAPRLEFRDLGYGPLGNDILTSPRIAPPMFGLGLLEAVAESDILAFADPDDRDGDGVKGRANRVWDAGNGRVALGRFGWKANQPSVHQQIAGAMIGDIGITSPIFPDQNCAPRQRKCAAMPSGGAVELTAGQLHKTQVYLFGVGVPARRQIDDPKVVRGEDLFGQIGCAACHRTQMTTTRSLVIDELGGQTIHPYTDLLLHDMGQGLADGRSDFLAGGRDWRTPPLWGLGLRPVVQNGQVGYLHDGRARTVLEAVLWHGGEAQQAADAVRSLDADDRSALIRFLESL